MDMTTKRCWLNKDGKANVCVDVNKQTWKDDKKDDKKGKEKQDNLNLDITLHIADCSRGISLEFGIYAYDTQTKSKFIKDIKERKDKLNKLRKMLDYIEQSLDNVAKPFVKNMK